MKKVVNYKMLSPHAVGKKGEIMRDEGTKEVFLEDEGESIIDLEMGMTMERSLGFGPCC